MLALKSYSQFRIEIRPCPAANDHEVRFFGDGEDLIAQYWNGMLGLDPDDILVASNSLEARAEPHAATVARCSCGVIGCDSIEVIIERSADQVRWSWSESESTQTLCFLAESYDQEVLRAQADTSWETPDRTAARLLKNLVDHQPLTDQGLTFNWGSGRLRPEKFSMSLILKPGPYQLLVHLPWDSRSPEAIAQQCVSLLRQPPSKWSEVEWYPQETNLGPPKIAGTGWREGGR